MPDRVGQQDVLGENISRVVKGFGLKLFKLGQVLQQDRSTNWTETYYRETAAELSPAGETWSIQGVARGAAFPTVNPSWTKIQGVQVKFAAEASVMIEDKLLDAFNVQKRTVIRVARSIMNQKDSYIYTEISTASGISTGAAVDTWDSTTVSNRDPVFDILVGIQTIDESNYDALENGFLLLNPKGHTNLIRHPKVISNPSFKTADVVSNGRVGQIAGLTIIKTTSVTADEALIIVGKRAATWKSAVPMRSNIDMVFGVEDIIASYEIGHVQVTDPAAIYKITNIDA